MKEYNFFNLSILIVNWNGGYIFKKCLKSIKREVKREKIKYEIIIVDNNSCVNEIKWLSKLNNKEIIIIKNYEMILNGCYKDAKQQKIATRKSNKIQ